MERHDARFAKKRENEPTVGPNHRPLWSLTNVRFWVATNSRIPALLFPAETEKCTLQPCVSQIPIAALFAYYHFMTRAANNGKTGLGPVECCTAETASLEIVIEFSANRTHRSFWTKTGRSPAPRRLAARRFNLKINALYDIGCLRDLLSHIGPRAPLPRFRSNLVLDVLRTSLKTLGYLYLDSI